MHICFVCAEYPPAPHGGIGSFTQTVAREYVRRGHRVTVVGGYDVARETTATDEGVRVIQVPNVKNPLAPIRLAANRRRLHHALQEIHRQHPVDIVEGGDVDMGMLARTSPGCKVLRMHGGPHFLSYSLGRKLPLISSLKEKWAYRVTNHVCAVSEYVAETTRRLLGLGNRTITVIPNPVDLDLFTPGAVEAEEDGLIVFTGTIMQLKGIRELVQAMPLVLREVPHARLRVYGGPQLNVPGAQEWADSVRASAAPEAAPRIEWMGRVPRATLPDALRRASVCVFPSHIEAMPIGWLEGLAAGKAVVASKNGPGPEIIDDEVTGLLCDPSRPESIAASLVRVLKDSALRRTLGVAARRVCVERYSLPTLIETNLEYYRRIVRPTT